MNLNTISFFLGVIVLLYVALGLIAGLAPISLWTYILDLFIEREQGTYYKIVPTNGESYEIYFLSIIGIVLVVFGKLKPKNNDNSAK